MIYGVTIILNDCNFSLKDRSKQVKERYSFNAFFTNKQAALQTYKVEARRVNNELGVVYGTYDLRGRCELYKAEVSNGKIMHYGKVIESIKID
jgi:hypothetical protein